MVNKLSQSQPSFTAARLPQSGAGFTLVELLVSIALLGILGGIGVSIFAVINNSYDTANALSRMQTQGAQVLEVLERSIRGASDVEVRSHDGDCTDTDNCQVIITIPPNSLEYSINGGCAQTVYDWTAPTSEDNGTLTRYYLTDTGDQCNDSTAIQLFDTDERSGVSVRKSDSAAIFTVNTGDEGISSVTIDMVLAEGVTVGSTATTIPLRTTVSLRDY